MIKILIDSSADLTKEEIEQRNVTMIPIQISLNEHHYLDGVNIDHDTFYQLLTTTNEFPKTSQPSPQEFVEAFEKAKEANDDLICIILSSAVSGTFQSAKLAKAIVEYDRIHLIDSLTAVSAIRILCDHALSMIKQNASVEEIVDSLNDLKGRIKIFAALNTLDYLAKGGRISKTAATIGELTNIKPIVTVSQEGKVEIAGKRLGINKSISFIKEKMAEFDIDLNYPIYPLYSYGQENLNKLCQKLNDSYPLAQALQIGPTIGAHIGTEAFGICFVSKN
ncbi:MAG: DegV family protein [Erysipelotrichaceae bacterium]|nr:DegV family protein [Erysipelotrichaceae bacterium]MDY5252117.1 DegV family protein [Erysipelotrichaceae bacterium]